MASGRDFLRQYRAALAARAAQQRIARQKWQRAAPQPGPGMARKAAERDEEGEAMTGDGIASD